jgi:hypothetical protein
MKAVCLSSILIFLRPSRQILEQQFKGDHGRYFPILPNSSFAIINQFHVTNITIMEKCLLSNPMLLMQLYFWIVNTYCVLCLTGKDEGDPVHAVKAYWALRTGRRSASRPNRLTPRERTFSIYFIEGFGAPESVWTLTSNEARQVIYCTIM